MKRSIVLTAGFVLVALGVQPASRSAVSGVERPVGARLQVSMTGPEGDPAHDAYTPTVVFNSIDNEFLVVWTAYTDPRMRSPANRGQRIDAATGAPVGENGFFISPNFNLFSSPYYGSQALQGHCAASVAHNTAANEYLVVSPRFHSDYDNREVYGQRLAADGTPIGGGLRLTTMTQAGDPFMEASCATVVYNATANEYFLVWVGQTGWVYRPSDGIRCPPNLYFRRLSGTAEFLGGVTRFDYCLTGAMPVAMETPLSVTYNPIANEYAVAWGRYWGGGSVWRVSADGATLTSAMFEDGCFPTPGAAANTATGDYLFVWNCNGLRGRRMAGGTLLETFVVSDSLVNGLPGVAYDSASNEYLAVWTRASGSAGSQEALETYGRSISAAGAPIGSAGVQISQMGAPQDIAYGAYSPAVTYRAGSNEALVVWSGDDNTNGHVNDEFEIYGQRYVATDPYVVGLASTSVEGGWMQQRGDAPAFGAAGWLQVPWGGYAATGGGVHPAMGDVDGDGRDEIVVGLDAAGDNWLAILDDSRQGHAVLRWIRLLWPYNGVPLYPAVGDIDGDGRAEIVVGLGPGTGGWFYLLDDATTGFAEIGWRQVDWPAYAAGDGRTHPAIGDVDGDGSAEIVIGLGPGSAGWVEVFNGAASGYSHRAWLHLPWEGYNAINGTTWPAAGDVDGDGVDEIVLGLGPGSDGWIAVLDDEAHGFATLRWLQIDWGGYNAASGETHPAVGNIDGDAAQEIIAGLGTWSSSEGGWYELFDDLIANTGSAGFAWRQVDWGGYNATGGGTYPAIARRGP